MTQAGTAGYSPKVPQNKVSIVSGSFLPNGSSAVATTYGAVGWTVARTGTGVFRVTITRPFAAFVSVDAGLTIDDALNHECIPSALTVPTASANGYFDITHVTGNAATAETYAVTVRLADISTASSVYVAVPLAGTITKIYSALGAAISGADAAVTCSIGATAITNGALTVAQSGSAAGDVDVATPSALNVVVAGDVLKVTTDGASTDTATLDVTFLIQVAAASTYAAADITASGALRRINFTAVLADSDVPGNGV